MTPAGDEPENISRRRFLRLFGLGGVAAGAILGTAGFGLRLFADPEALANPEEAGGAERWVYSTCGFCGVGCATWLGVRGNRVVAVRGVSDYPVNRGLLCVKGIYQYKLIDVPGRGTHPLIRRAGSLEPIPWSEAFDFLAGRLRRFVAASGPEAVALYYGEQLVLEEAYVIGKFARGALGTPYLESNGRLCTSSPNKAFKETFEVPVLIPSSFEDIELADYVILAGANMAETFPVLFNRLQRSRRLKRKTVVAVDPRRTMTAAEADLHLRLRPGSDVFLYGAMAAVLIEEGLYHRGFVAAHTTGFGGFRDYVRQFTPDRAAAETGLPAELIRRVARDWGSAGSGLIFAVRGVDHATRGTLQSSLLNSLCLLTGKIGRPGAGILHVNGQGFAPSGQAAGAGASLPGLRPFEREDKKAELAALWGVDVSRFPKKEHPITSDIWEAIEAGKVRCLWIICTNPAVSMPDAPRFRELLRRVELVVVQDCYADTDTARLADLYLPAALWAEKDGVVINVERRANRVKKAVEPPGQALPDWLIVAEVGRRLGFERMFPYRSSEEIFQEWRRVSAGTPADMKGMTYERIERERGLQYPCPYTEHPGTQRLHEDWRFPPPDNKARLTRPRPIPPLHMGGESGPDPGERRFVLFTGRVLEHWQTGTKTRRVPELALEAGFPHVEVNPADAAGLGIGEGDRVRLRSEATSQEVVAGTVITDRVSAGILFMPFHYAEAPVNALIPRLLDPESKMPQYKHALVTLEPAR